jgi:hypothetical protein
VGPLRSQAYLDGDDDHDHRPRHQQRRDPYREAQPPLERDVVDGEHRDNRAVGRCDEIEDTGRVLVGEDRRLAREAEQVRERHEDRHRQYRLTTPARDRDVDEGLVLGVRGVTLASRNCRRRRLRCSSGPVA